MANIGRHADALAAIYAEPRSDAHRHVYADLLLEAGDPRGEFIALQMLPKRTRAQGKRATTLLKAHRDEWLGPLEPAIRKNGFVFERGFLARARLLKSGVPPRLLGDPAWATLVEIDARSGWGTRAELFLQPALQTLTVLRGIHLATAVELFESRRPPQLVEMRLDRVAVYDREQMSAARVEAAFEQAADRMPTLRRLAVASIGFGTSALQWLLERPIGRRLEWLRIGGFSDLAWLVANRELLPPEVVASDGWAYKLSDNRLRIEFEGEQRHHADFPVLAAALGALHGASIKALVFALPRWLVPDEAELAQLEMAVAGIRVDEPVTLPPVDGYY